MNFPNSDSDTVNSQLYFYRSLPLDGLPGGIIKDYVHTLTILETGIKRSHANFSGFANENFMNCEMTSTVVSLN